MVGHAPAIKMPGAAAAADPGTPGTQHGKAGGGGNGGNGSNQHSQLGYAVTIGSPQVTHPSTVLLMRHFAWLVPL